MWVDVCCNYFFLLTKSHFKDDERSWGPDPSGRRRKRERERENLTQKPAFAGQKIKKKNMNFVDGDKRPTNTGGIDDTVKLAAGKMDALVGMDEDGDMQKDYTWDCVIFGDGS